jgi:hypothetical protein
MTCKCDWPNCQKTSEQPFADGWTACGAFPELGVPDDSMLCPEHAAEYDEAAEQECYGDADVILLNGWAGRAEGGFAIVGYEAVTEKGETFLTAYAAEVDGLDDDDDAVIGSGTMPAEELMKFKRMAAAAGVKLKDTTRAGRVVAGASPAN